MKTLKILLLTVGLSLITSGTAQAEEESQIWAVVDENGIVQNITVCSESICGDDGEWKGVSPIGTPWEGMRLVRQNNNTQEGGFWGTYNYENQTFYVDRPCSTCDVWEDLISPGIIRDGILTPPIFKKYEDLLLEQELNVEKASSLIAYTMAYRQATSFKNNIKLSKNLKKFKKVSRTQDICIVRKNRVLIKKSGYCKILVEGKKNKRVVKMKVYK
jgi:hypothetical protein